ncbi:MAG: PLP-dependent aminotransferase family protein [Emergencia sp.]
MRISINKELRTPLYWQIADQIKAMILGGQLTNGAVLPSERSLAALLGVHRNTVIKAYGLLKDMELVDSVQGVGYRVTYESSEFYEPDVRKKVNWSTIIKDEYQDMEHTFDDIFQRFGEENHISLSTGMAPAVYDEEELAAAMASILQEEGRRHFFLSPYQGDMTLRQRIITYLRTKGIQAGISQVQILSETNQALDFIITAILKEGDKVIIEEPVSPDVYRVIELAGCRAVTVPVDENGMVCDNLEALIETHRPKFIYVNSSYHDPTGNILSVERRRKLLEVSNRYRLPIIEEDAASELSFEENFLPAIKSMDRSDNVIYIYSFALTFIPGLSMAFVVAPEKLIKSLSYLVSIRIMSLDWLTQKLLARYLTDGKYYENAEKIAKLNKEKRDIMCSYLDRLKPLGVSYQKPRGGVYVWCRLPAGIDSKEVVSACDKRGVSIIPGEIFYPHRNGGQNHVRLNFSYETESRLRLGMENFNDVICRLSRGEDTDF